MQVKLLRVELPEVLQGWSSRRQDSPRLLPSRGPDPVPVRAPLTASDRRSNTNSLKERGIDPHRYPQSPGGSLELLNPGDPAPSASFIPVSPVGSMLRWTCLLVTREDPPSHLFRQRS